MIRLHAAYSNYYKFIYLLERGRKKGKTDLRQLDVKNEDEQVSFHSFLGSKIYLF